MHTKKILLCVSGGIAAYKAIDLASQLVKLNYSVKCVLTANATKFVSPLNFAAITHNGVSISQFEDVDPIPHISLADWADMVVIAPATANIIAKAACGIGDDLMSTIFLAHRKPLLFVPAMNVNMFNSEALQENIVTLQRRGHHFLEPEQGMLACGYVGKGKYPSNTEVIAAIATYLDYPEDLKGKKVLLTAGATIEEIDPMRYLSNRSSGKMGLALARALALRGAEVSLVYGNISLPIPHYLHEAVCCLSAQEMYKAVMERYKQMDWIIKCAAVADFRPGEIASAKLPKADKLNLCLIPTTDILQELGKHKLKGQKLIGFAAQTEDLIPKALEKYHRKQLDLVCVNHIKVAGEDASELMVIGKMAGYPALNEDAQLAFARLSGDKLSIANSIVDAIKAL